MTRRRPWWRSPLWEAERAALADSYPGATLIERDGRALYRVQMRPMPTDHQPAVVADLEAERFVRILSGGRLAHSPNCNVKSGEHVPPVEVTLSQRTYQIELELPEQLRGPAGDIHPRARVATTWPLPLTGASSVTPRTYQGHPHLSFAHDEDGWACPLPPHDTDWCWEAGALVTYLDYVAIWLVKTEVWRKTHHWLGPGVSHEPAEVLGIAEDSACRCGSGRYYRSCHRPSDERRFKEGSDRALPTLAGR